MKKFLGILTILCVTALFTSCTKTYQTKLRSTADQLNRELPMNLGNGMHMDSVVYDTDDNTMMLYYSSDEEFGTVGNMRNAHDSQRRFIKTYLSSDSGKEFTKLLADAEANICLTYIGKKTGDKVELTLYANEIKELLESQEETADDYTQLASLVAITNDQCPIQINGEDLVMTGLEIGDKALCFNYSYNPEVYEFSPETADAFKAALLPELTKELSAAGNGKQLELMKKLGFGVDYKFSAEGREPLIIGFTPEQIAEI